MEHALTFNNLTLGYNNKIIIEGLSSKIKAGKFTALIGPNGCGKSTLLKSVVNLVSSKSGDITLANGESVQQLKSKQLAQCISLLPQTPITPEGVTVRELVGFGRAPYLNIMGSLSKDDHHYVAQAMKRANVEEFANSPLSSLSGGQRQRVWIAMILAQNTDIVLLDEPTTYLDLCHQYELLDILAELVTQGKTVVVVLHDLNQACRYADELIVMKAGELFIQGDSKSVMTEEMLEEVFNLDASIITDPESDTAMLIPRIKSSKK
ncbi:MAG: ATP-binding cassette domain-containing protein [Aliivibrio sp.]|uniref:ATP-binding cassette domain-containing protein n=1 Tax=Aliivibrio sp. TaxID=1872443 RepID=UPI001A5D05D9|nr:ATP-binding cassette domain-containing protein [Aliivibrio sp.]